MPPAAGALTEVPERKVGEDSVGKANKVLPSLVTIVGRSGLLMGWWHREHPAAFTMGQPICKLGTVNLTYLTGGVRLPAWLCKVLCKCKVLLTHHCHT